MHSTTHLPECSKADARVRGPARLGALLALPVAALAPALASGDIYKWTDARGQTVVSDVAPVDPAGVSGLKLLAASRKPAAQAAKADAVPATGPEEPGPNSDRVQELEARIEELERRLQAQQSAPQTPPPANAPASDQPAPPPPPVPVNDYANPAPVIYQSAYPSYYRIPPPAYTVVVVGTRPLLHRRAPPPPVFLPRPKSEKRPLFAGPQPQFRGHAPQFAGGRPQIQRPQQRFPNRTSPGVRPHPMRP